MEFKIGDLVVDSDGTVGVVCIKWSDGDIVGYENDAAHPEPVLLSEWIDTEMEDWTITYDG